jgi:hypothetical protein
MILRAGIALRLATVIAAIAGAPRDAAAEPSAGPTVPEFDRPVALAVPLLLLRCSGADAAELTAQLRLRAPDLRVEIVGDGDRVDAPPPFAHAILHRDGDAPQRWSLAVVLSNGDAYHRSFEAEAADAERIAATTTIALLYGWTLANPLPSTPTAATTTSPAVAATPVAITPPPRPPRRPPPPRDELGIALDGGTLQGFGPPRDNDGLAAGLVGLAARARLRRGVIVALGLRAATRTRFDYTLVRGGIVPRAGYGWRFGRIELALEGQLSIERWWLLRRGHLAAIDTRVGPEEASPWVLGAGARFAPGYRFVRGRDALRIAAFTSVGGASMILGGVANIAVPNTTGSAVDAFRVGGFEWAIGLELAWSREIVRRSKTAL